MQIKNWISPLVGHFLCCLHLFAVHRRWAYCFDKNRLLLCERDLDFWIRHKCRSSLKEWRSQDVSPHNETPTVILTTAFVTVNRNRSMMFLQQFCLLWSFASNPWGKPGTLGKSPNFLSQLWIVMGVGHTMPQGTSWTCCVIEPVSFG